MVTENESVEELKVAVATGSPSLSTTPLERPEMHRPPVHVSQRQMRASEHQRQLLKVLAAVDRAVTAVAEVDFLVTKSHRYLGDALIMVTLLPQSH